MENMERRKPVIVLLLFLILTEMRRIHKLSAVLFTALLLIACRHDYIVKDSGGEYFAVEEKAGQHESTEQFIRPWRDSLDKTMNHIIGVAENTLIVEYPESTLGNFVCDLMLDTLLETDKTGMKNRDNCFCLMNAKGLRAPLPKGEIPLKRVYEIMPFENEAVIIKLDFSQVRVLLDKVAETGGQPVSSNIKMQIKDGKCTSFTVNGNNEERAFWVITSDYIANGGDGFSMLKEAKARENTGYKIRDMIKDAIVSQNATGKKVNAVKDGRVEKI